VLANAIFLVRSGLWVLPAVLLGVLYPAFRNPASVLSFWSAGCVASLMITLWCWRELPWRRVMLEPVDWQWIRQGVKKSTPFWVGMIGLIGGSFSDRFVIDHFLTYTFVGILTFYGSFNNAMLTLMQSGVIVFSYPRLIALHRDRDAIGFHREVWHTARQMAFGATIIALVLGIAVPLLGPLLHRPELVEQDRTLWLLLLGTWLRVNGEVFFFVMFARHQDRPLWLGNLLFLIPALGGSMLLVPLAGFSGIGYSSILSCFLLLLWRLWYTRDLLGGKLETTQG
jgi:O-antigen/teichoic acid export membrane protein